MIDRVGLRDFIPSLETVIEVGSSSYSSGQKQLICIIRAAINMSKILILDEASANIDTTTERLLTNIVNEIFKDSTILAIAHRLHMIMDYDKILVLDNGNIVEFDDPKALLNNENSFVKQIWDRYKMD